MSYMEDLEVTLNIDMISREVLEDHWGEDEATAYEGYETFDGDDIHPILSLSYTGDQLRELELNARVTFFGDEVKDGLNGAELLALIEEVDAIDSDCEVAFIMEYWEEHGEMPTAAHGYWVLPKESFESAAEVIAYHYLEDCGEIDNVPEHLKGYIDIEAYGRDLMYDHEELPHYIYCEN